MAFKAVGTVATLLTLLSFAAAQDYSWTAWFSEQDPDGQNCQFNQSVAAVRCSGRNCGTLQLGCLGLPADAYLEYADPQRPSYWSNYISDDTSPSLVECDWGTNGLTMGLLIGMKSSGFESDIISVHCVPLGAGSLQGCDWTAPFSDDEGEQDFPEGYFATAVQCGGRNCGTLSFRICRIE